MKHDRLALNGIEKGFGRNSGLGINGKWGEDGNRPKPYLLTNCHGTSASHA